ncbi:hypothetical protein ASD71_08625 [Achromobacter sp. Root565]|nr:hypothetical protein ASD71_08625 [Achromobacter sp. Root565]
MSLAAKLRTDFGITLPTPDAEAESDAAAWLEYFGAVERVVARQPRWRVCANEVMLGFFSFGKFLMYKDLDPETWPKEKQPSDHPWFAA